MGEALVAVDLLVKLLAQAQAVSGMIAAHQKDGTPIELDALAAADDEARKGLAAAIAAARASPPTSS